MTPDVFNVCRGAVRRTVIAVAAGGVCAVLLSIASAQESRTWTDATGKFKVEARFVKISNDKVTLEKEDGAQITVPLKKLSKADQEAVKELQSNEENPFTTVKPQPKTSRQPKSEEESRGDAEESDATVAGPKIIQPDWSGAKQILSAGVDAKWSLSPEAPKQPPAGKRRAIGLPPKSDFFEGVKALVVNPVCRRAVIEYMLDKHDSNSRLRIFVCDLEKGKLISTLKAAGKVVPLALNDAGTDVLMRRDEFGFGNQDRLEIWRLTRSGVKKVLQWTPHDDQQGGQRDIKWARFVGDDKLLTASNGGKLTIWNPATAEPLSWLQISGGCYPALSPDRKHLAFATNNEIGILDIGNGEVIAMQAAPKTPFFNPVFAFTPKGTRLVCGAGDRLYVFDSATGALYRDILLAGSNIFCGENLLCPSEEHVLMGNSLLIDIESQAKVWTYRGHELVNMLDGVCWLAVVGQESSVLIPAVLPHPGAVEKIRQALDSADFFIVKPGVTVKLNVDGIQDPGEREKAVAALTRQLQVNGCQVGPNGTAELVAATEMGKRRNIAYHTFGHIGAREYTFQEYTSRVKMVYNGQTAWEVSCGNAPGFVRLKEGETMQEYLKNNEHPNYEWFSKVELPKIVQKPTSAGATLGTTNVTVSGLR